MNRKVLPVLALLLGIGFGANAQMSNHIRFKQGPNSKQDGELQIAVTEYVGTVAPNTSQTTIILYGVVHVADESYYKKVQRDLDSYDTVLYEGVKQGSKPNAGTRGLNALQKLMGDVLGLTFQKDGIDYRRRHFVHADVDIDQLRKTLKGQPLDPLEQLISPELMKQLGPLLDLASEFIKMYMDSNPGLQDQLKVQFAQQLSQADITAQMTPEMKKAILDDRNQIVQEVLERELRLHPEKRRIAIFYGAAHMPDFEQRLARLGFKRGSQRWMTAWRMGRGALAEKPRSPSKRKKLKVY
jgi:hypothetical protein